VASLLQTRAGRLVAALLAVLALAVAVGLIALWPRDDAPVTQPIAPQTVQDAEVVRVSGEGCEDLAGPGCRLVEVVLLDGPDAGAQSFFALPGGGFAPDLEPGDRIRVGRNEIEGRPVPLDDLQAQPLVFIDFDRGGALLALTIAFAVIVVALARWQGVRSLVSLAISLVVIVAWLVPALLDGRPPLLAALVAGLAVMLVTTALTHGIGLKSGAAMLGAAGTLVVIVLLALLAVDVAHITGLASEEANLIEARADVSLQGLVLAGIVVGALGVLDDVTISQSSTVLALRRANPAFPLVTLFREAMAVGRDHLGATVNTLALAYAGGSLPVLLIFATQGTGFGDAISREAVAEELVATLVGSIGLVAAVPLTTALAALLATRD
jgi:YibE/F-like protein